MQPLLQRPKLLPVNCLHYAKLLVLKCLTSMFSLAELTNANVFCLLSAVSPGATGSRLMLWFYGIKQQELSAKSQILLQNYVQYVLKIYICNLTRMLSTLRPYKQFRTPSPSVLAKTGVSMH